MSEIVIPYSPRHHWRGKDGLHARLDGHRFSVIVAHRRFGKTVGVLNHLVRRAVSIKLPKGRFAYVAPYSKQAKRVAWDYLKRYTAVIPHLYRNETELLLRLPNGAEINVYGAENAEALRGLYFDGIVVDEVADIRPNVWGEVIRPALSDRRGWAVFIGTPRGMDAFYELYNRALTSERWFAGLYRADETGVLPDDELAAMREELSDNQYRQEMLCDFNAAADDTLISLDAVMAAEIRGYCEDDIRHAARVMGVDVARFGDDASVVTMRQGLAVLGQREIRKRDNMTLASLVAAEIDRFRPDAVFVDAGRGEGVIDRLRQLGYSVIEVNFGGRAISERYANKRSEMWAECAEWLKVGMIPSDLRLRQELTQPRYAFDAAGKLKLEAKDRIKERCGFSTDFADSLCLTFAMPVMPRGMREDQASYKYDPFEGM